MKTYIFIEIDDEDGIQIPIITTANSDQEAIQKLDQLYYNRYESHIEELMNFASYIIFTTDRELIDYEMSQRDFPEIWNSIINKDLQQ